ncbi:Uma2 family endonuclease [Nostoc sphaeroides]|uniref:Uma2 family endonuclease n=1 Tax=Nostoc sphaeroides TaxID=446679 RepID=UPI000E557F20|nr:Uma2 family endonuclease [Nostoc sphaeroides]
MSVAKSASLTLEEFLKLPETKPASLYIDGEIILKPMPKTRHSRLQAKLIDGINDVLDGVDLKLTVEQLFGWLNMKAE